MKKVIILIILFVTVSAKAQVYVDLSVDPNKIFNVIDNPRTEDDHQGLDLDLEVGFATPKVGVYAFYGMFREMKYQNYGVGVDYYLTRGDWYDISLGVQLTSILRPMKVYDTNGDFAFYTDYWGNNIGYAARMVGTFWAFKNMGLSGRFQYQTRPDLPNTFGIVEGSVGIRYKFK